jgi:hypothetical protein
MIAFLTVLLVVSAVAQTLTTRDAHRPDYLVRMIHVASHVSNGVTGEKSCLIVSPDGRFRMESSDPIYGSNTKPKVYSSSLTPEALQALQALLESNQLKELQTPEAPTPAPSRDLDMFVAEIARGDHVQEVSGFKDDRHSKTDASVQNLENWMIGIGKQKLPLDKTTTSNTCKAL